MNKTYNTDTIDNELDLKLDKGNLPSNIQSGERLLELVKNNSGLEFDENLLYIQDTGTKVAGKYYFDKTQTGLFRCIADTDIVYNSANFFVNESNYENSKNIEKLMAYSEKRYTIYNTFGVSDGAVLHFKKQGNLVFVQCLAIVNQGGINKVLSIANTQFIPKSDTFFAIVDGARNIVAEIMIMANGDVSVQSASTLVGNSSTMTGVASYFV